MTTFTNDPAITPLGAGDAAQSVDWADIDRLGAALAKPLRAGERALAHDIGERLRTARTQAALRQQQMLTRASDPAAPTANPAATGGVAWWKKALAAIPIAAAGAGVIFMQGAVSDDGAGEIVHTDVHILANEVPPTAFSDPGFLQYLKDQDIDLGAPASTRP